MPAHPSLHPRVLELRSSVFAVLAEKMARLGGRVLPLHIGDTCRLPPAAALCSSAPITEPAGLYQYGHPFGLPALLEALAAKLRRRNGLDWARPEHVQVSCGATHALFCATQALFGPGDEVLVLAPYWPLITGILQCTGARPVQVPFYQALLDRPDLDPLRLVEPYLTERTVALYINTPNNPDGCVLGRTTLEALAHLCCSRSLWALSDEAYEDYLYDGREHLSLASLPGMAERTLSVYTFSKSHALSGLRVGYVVCGREPMNTLRRIANHSVYNTPVLSQRAALAALEQGEAWLAQTHKQYQAAADLVRTRLKGRFHPAQGGAYVFYDTTAVAPDVWSFIDRALEAGVSLAPGEAFGRDFAGFVRICFTAVELPELAEAIDRLNAVL
jgi:aspartate/methionine/tyrosine aminotransferase